MAHQYMCGEILLVRDSRGTSLSDNNPVRIVELVHTSRPAYEVVGMSRITGNVTRQVIVETQLMRRPGAKKMAKKPVKKGPPPPTSNEQAARRLLRRD